MQEYKRLTGRKFLILVVVGLFINALILVNRYKTWHDKYKIYDMFIKNANDYMAENENYESFDKAARASYNAYAKANGINKDTITKEMVAARTMLLERAAYVDSFKANVDKKIDNATKLAISGFFDENSFEMNNLLKSRYDLKNVDVSNISLDNGTWLEELFSYEYVQIFVIILLCVLVYGTFAERKQGLYYIIHLSERGRGALFVKRFLTMIIQSVVLSGVFYIESAAILIYNLGGLKWINNPAYTYDSFLITTGNLTRVQFLGVMILFSAFLALVVAVSMWLVLSFFANTNIGILVYVILCAAEFILYIAISSKHAVRILHFINIYYLFYPQKALRYDNWGYSWGIASIRGTVFVFACIIALVCLGFNCYMYVKKYFSGRSNVIERLILRVQQMFMKLLRGMPSSVKEAYKVLVSQKVAIMLALLIYVVVKIDIPSGFLLDFNTAYAKQYYVQANGLSYGDELMEIYAEYEEEYNTFAQSLDINDPEQASILENHRQQFLLIQNHVNYMKECNEKGIDAVVAWPYDYEDIFKNKQRDNQMLLVLVNIMAAIMISSTFMSYEKRCSMDKMAMASSGRNRWKMQKLFVNCAIMLLFWMTTYGIYVNKLLEKYKIDNLDVPVKSLPMFKDLPINPSIIALVIMHFVAFFVFLCALMFIMGVLSYRLNYAYTSLAGMVIIVPQILWMMGYVTLYKMSIGYYAAYFPAYFDGINVVYYLAAFGYALGILAILRIFGVLGRER